MPDGSFSAAELMRLQAEGNLDVHEPGTPGHEAGRREMADELAYADAELLALEGPDALTSARLLRQTALSLASSPEHLAHAFGEWCAFRGWEWPDLADFLGVTVDQLAAMALVPTCQAHLAERYGADPSKLATVLGGA
jgi:hypothetical protein